MIFLGPGKLAIFSVSATGVTALPFVFPGVDNKVGLPDFDMVTYDAALNVAPVADAGIGARLK